MAALEEQETTINYRRCDDHAEVWTSDLTVMTRLDKLCENSDMYECIDIARSRFGELLSKTYRIKDKSLISFRSNKVKRELTDEQKEELRQRFQNVRKG